jgi:hypothetical protein
MSTAERDRLQALEAAHRARLLAASACAALPLTEPAPSTVTREHWVYAESAAVDRRATDAIVGKWLLFTPAACVDSDWRLVSLCTRAGLLGAVAKGATARPNGNAQNADTKVICVYTSADVAEQDRAVAVLRALGFRATLFYKTDAATIQGHYAHNSAAPVTSRRAAGCDAAWWEDAATSRAAAAEFMAMADRLLAKAAAPAPPMPTGADGDKEHPIVIDS